MGRVSSAEPKRLADLFFRSHREIYVVITGSKIIRPDMMGPRGPGGVIEQAADDTAAPRESHGLGDWVETWAHPIGCWLDRRTAAWPKRRRTRLCGCRACSGRQQRWNGWVPEVKRWKGGWQVGCTTLAKALLRRFLSLIDRTF
jgi:hypothetical protein